jgi:hypothetical protein
MQGGIGDPDAPRMYKPWPLDMQTFMVFPFSAKA